ncbi:MAG TPA: SMC-Scp complex subunit ScpB [bacterium]|nr:SMC-Scp complex subunit ScpB [bacterium]HPN31564.1 SMC-Scp complex subunit ScpB [bacterium]
MNGEIESLKIQSDILDDLTVLEEYKKLKDEITDVSSEKSNDENLINENFSEQIPPETKTELESELNNDNITETDNSAPDVENAIEKEESAETKIQPDTDIKSIQSEPSEIKTSETESDTEFKAIKSEAIESKSETELESEPPEIPEYMLKPVIESLLFISGNSITFEKMQKTLKIDFSKFRKYVFELNNLYKQNNHCFRIVEVANGFQLVTKTELADYIRRFFGARKIKHFPPSALEVLAIVAYKQPVTKATVEHIRGVNSDAQIQVLIEKKMAHIIGRAEELGRPLLYGTTKEFLEYFGLKDLSELPDSKELDQILSEQRSEEKQKVEKILGEISGADSEIGKPQSDITDTEKSLQERIERENKELEEEKLLDQEFAEALVKTKQTKKNAKELFEKFNSDSTADETIGETRV